MKHTDVSRYYKKTCTSKKIKIKIKQKGLDYLIKIRA